MTHNSEQTSFSLHRNTLREGGATLPSLIVDDEDHKTNFLKEEKKTDNNPGNDKSECTLAQNKRLPSQVESCILPKSASSLNEQDHLLSYSLQTDRSSDSHRKASSLESLDKKHIELSTGITLRSRPLALLRKSEELKNPSSDESSSEGKRPSNLVTEEITLSNRESSFLTDIIIHEKSQQDENNTFLSASQGQFFGSRPVLTTLTFDAFVDKIKGQETTSIDSTYPSYKIDKRLIFLGKKVSYPWHIISYHSRTRRLWNLFITLIIIYELLWYPYCCTFIYGDKWFRGSLVFEIITVVIFILDIFINMRTTYSNENNEEIIDGKMMRQNYFNSKLFFVDLITTFPIPEILLLVLVGNEKEWEVYDLVLLIRMLRIFKIPHYIGNRTYSTFEKLLHILIPFAVLLHWVSCFWFLLLKIEFPEEPNISNVWFPNDLRMIAGSDDDLWAYYYHMREGQVYLYTLMQVFMISVGADMAPVTNVQIYMTIVIGLFGCAGIAFVYARIVLTINRANLPSRTYDQQLEDLKRKLHTNNVPENLRIKIMEYFYYSNQKKIVLKRNQDFSELSLPLQRDLALYQYHDMIKTVPLFHDLEPMEILSIVKKLQTAIYMPGDRIIREGEKAREMYLIQEGVVEIKTILQHGGRASGLKNTKPKYESVFIKQGDYFGETALLVNARRNFDADAFEFCILHSFSKSDYEDLKVEFKGIRPRLKSGLKYYKKNHMGQIAQILKKSELFHDFTEADLQKIGNEYMEEVFVDPFKVILTPRAKPNAIYVLLSGKVCSYPDSERIQGYLASLKRTEEKDNWTIVENDEDSRDIDCFDDDILNLEKDKFSIESHRKKLDINKIHNPGEHFGSLDYIVNEVQCSLFYMTETGCRLGVITDTMKEEMAVEDRLLYAKLRHNILKNSSKRIMPAIREESESSFGTSKNSTLIKARISRRESLFSDLGRVPMLFHAPSNPNANKDEDLTPMKMELKTFEDQLMNFEAVVSDINTMFNKLVIIDSQPKTSVLPPTADKSPFHSKDVRMVPVKSKSEAVVLMKVHEEESREESVSISMRSDN